MKIDITKNTWVNDIQADFIREGFWTGSYAIQISFSGGACPSDDILSEILMKCIKTELPVALKVVRFKGLFDPKDNDIALFMHSLKSYGFTIQIIIPSGFSAPWLDKFDWVILRNDRDIVLHNANEIWHVPSEAMTLKEPTVPEKPGMLYVTKGRSVVETVKFITSSKYVWRIL